MKKLLFTVAALLCITTASMAQFDPSTVNFNTVINSMPQAARDSMVINLRQQLKDIGKKGNYTLNGQQASSKMTKVLRNWYKNSTLLMLGVLEHPTLEVAERNQHQLSSLMSKFHYDMNLLTEELEYNTRRQEIINEYKNGDYDDADERREARKDMNDELKDLKDDYKDTIKDLKQDRKEEMRNEA